MIAVGATIIIVLALLLANELWYRTHARHGELSRKFIHIAVGTFVAFWPFFLTRDEIIILAAAFLLVVAVSREARLFRAIHSVQRTTWGELFFAIAVGLVAFLTSSRAIFAAAILHMSLADGLAALVGTRFGKRNSYRVLGAVKSAAGTLTFLVVSLALLIGFSLYARHLNPVRIAGTAVGAMLLENVGVAGLDNVLVPVAVVAALLN